MPTCVPIKDMRNTAAFSKLVDASTEPITITKNGYDQFVVLKSEEYTRLCKLQAENDLMQRIMIAERERANKEFVDTQESLSSLRKAHGL